MFKRLLNFKATLLALEIAFIFCFFVGIFWNPPITTELFDSHHRFYINRGYPTAWAGVSAIDKTVKFPIIKAPFLVREIWEDRSKWAKIIDLRIFIPLFLITFLISYLPSFIIVKAVEENKSLNFILIPLYFVLFLACIFLYVFWFPRI